MIATKDKPLTIRQAAFIPLFCDPGSGTYNNITLSMTSAGYSENFAKHRQDWMLANVGVKAAVEAYRAEKARKINVTAEELVAQLRILAGLDEIPKDSKIKPLANTDVKGAIELLGKHKGMFKDVNINLNAEIPLDPTLRKQWLKDELARLEECDRLNATAQHAPIAIASRTSHVRALTQGMGNERHKDRDMGLAWA